MKFIYYKHMWTIFIILISYLVGSIPTSIIAGNLIRGIDIRDYGSHNPGATNTFRVLGKKIGVAVGLIDIFKGFFAVYFLPGMFPQDANISHEVRMLSAGFAVVSGHMWTVFAGFKGGKGVGAAFGVFLALAPIPTLAAFAVWSIVTFCTGYVSLGSIMSAVVLPVSYAVIGVMRGNFSWLIEGVSLILGILVIVRHRSNIGRLLRGEENRFGKHTKS
jgi:glycerol-3-phosphate acyltransferase PlsY